MSLAAFLDLVGEGLEAPVLRFADGTAAIRDDLPELLSQRLDLLGRDLLARQEDMLVKWHEDLPFTSFVHPGAEPLSRPVPTADKARCERPQRRPQRAETPAARAGTPAARPNRAHAHRSAPNRHGFGTGSLYANRRRLQAFCTLIA